MTKVLLLLSIGTIWAAKLKEEQGTTIKSETCGALIWLQGMKIDDKAVSFTASDQDVCKKADSTRTFTVGSGSHGDIEMQFKTGPSNYELTSIKVGENTYKAFEDKNLLSSYTHVPSGPMRTAYACQYTKFQYNKFDEEDKLVSSSMITFDYFTAQLNACPKNKCSAVNDYYSINQCVSFLSPESLICILTIIMLFSFSGFGVYMLSGITTPTKFEDIKMKPVNFSGE